LTGRSIDVSSLSKIQKYRESVHSIDAENSLRILRGDEPNVPYPSYPLGGLSTITHADVASLGIRGK
jgi:hypothetical protein